MNGFRQNGSALIIVLVVVMLLTIIGVMAVRSGLLGLNIATNSQASHIMDQNNSNQQQVLVVSSFDELVNTAFSGKNNAINWQRNLEGDFEEIVSQLILKDDITIVSIDDLNDLSLSEDGIVGYFQSADAGTFHLALLHMQKIILAVARKRTQLVEFLVHATGNHATFIDQSRRIRIHLLIDAVTDNLTDIKLISDASQFVIPAA